MANSSSGTGWRQRPTGFLAGIAAVVLVVVLLGGMAIGYEIEKSRVKSPKTAATAKKAPAKAVQIRVVGTVSAVSPTSITVAPAKGAARKVTLGKATVVVKAGAGAASDIAANTRVVWSGAAGSFTSAKIVIVLAATARIGTKVNAADATTMTLQNNGKVTKVTTTGATVNKTAPATVASIAKGDKVMVGAVRAKTGQVTATEIVVLPSNSTFQ
jgi:uncharacterized protein YabE (DUF348 family)